MRMIVGAGVGALVMAMTAACGGDDKAAAPSPSASASRPETWERVPAKDREALLTYLAKIDPGLAGNDAQRKRSLRRAVDTCNDIAAGKKGTELAIVVSQRYTGGQARVTIGDARRVAAAVQRYICPAL
jgi:hypothetical protein